VSSKTDKVEISNCVFRNNDGNVDYGGALFYDIWYLALTLTNNSFCNLQSRFGGAIFFKRSFAYGTLISGNYFTGCSSQIGGAVYFGVLFDVASGSNHFMNNKALIGPALFLAIPSDSSDTSFTRRIADWASCSQNYLDNTNITFQDYGSCQFRFLFSFLFFLSSDELFPVLQFLLFF
jgi:hypothetical protein